MPWNATTDRDAADAGTLVHIDRGYADVPPQPGETIRIANRASGQARVVTVVSASGDRLEIADGDRIVTLKPSSAERSAILDESGRYFESWIVL